MLTKEMRFMMDVVVVGGFGFEMRMGKREKLKSTFSEQTRLKLPKTNPHDE